MNCVYADHPQRQAAGTGSQGLGIHLQHGRGNSHLRVPGYQGVDRFVKAALGAAQAQVGLATDRAGRLGKLIKGRGIDQVH